MSLSVSNLPTMSEDILKKFKYKPIEDVKASDADLLLRRAQGFFHAGDYDVTLDKAVVRDPLIGEIAEKMSVGTGMTFVGPTGSGKTTAILGCLNHARRRTVVMYAGSPFDLIKLAEIDEISCDVDLFSAPVLGLDNMHLLDQRIRRMTNSQIMAGIQILHDVLDRRGKEGKITFLSLLSESDTKATLSSDDPVMKAYDAFKSKTSDPLSFLPSEITNRIQKYCPIFKMGDNNFWK